MSVRIFVLLNMLNPIIMCSELTIKVQQWREWRFGINRWLLINYFYCQVRKCHFEICRSPLVSTCWIALLLYFSWRPVWSSNCGSGTYKRWCSTRSWFDQVTFTKIWPPSSYRTSFFNIVFCYRTQSKFLLFPNLLLCSYINFEHLLSLWISNNFF